MEELPDDELLAEFDLLSATMADQTASFSEEEVQADIAAAIAESRRDAAAFSRKGADL